MLCDGDRRVGCSRVVGTGYRGSLSSLRLSRMGMGCWLLWCSRAGQAGEAGLHQMPLCMTLHGNPSCLGPKGHSPTYTASLSDALLTQNGMNSDLYVDNPLPTCRPPGWVWCHKGDASITTQSYSKKVSSSCTAGAEKNS